MTEIVRWYLVTTCVGIGALLPSLVAFGQLRSGGLLFARPLGLLILGVGAWCIAATTPIAYGTPLAGALLLLLYGWSGALAWHRPALLRALRSRWRVVAIGEAVFLVAFLSVLYIATRAPAAAINEQPFDLLLLNVLRNTTTIPAGDPWLGGYDLAYYYLGPTMVDIAGRLAEIEPWIEYHLAFASAGAAATTSVFAVTVDAVALGTTRRRSTPWLAGGLAVVFLLLVSGTPAVLILLTANGIGDGFASTLGVWWLPISGPTRTAIPTEMYWWAYASQVIPGALTEFPGLTLLYGNLHAHWLALAYGPIAIAIAMLTLTRVPPQWAWWWQAPGSLAISALLFAGLAMMNTWDAVVWGILWAAAAVGTSARESVPRPGAAFRIVTRAAWHLLPPTILAILIAMPYLFTLRTPVGLELLTADTRSAHTGGAWSDPIRFTLVWSTLLVPLATTLVLLRPPVSGRVAAAGALFGGALVGLWMIGALSTGAAASIFDRGTNWLTLAALIASLAFAAGATWRARREERLSLAVALGLVTIAALTMLLTEVVYIREYQGGRTNTVFKFWYAAWGMLSVGLAVLLSHVVDRPPRARRLLLASPLIVFAVLLSATSLWYVPAGTVSKIREGQRPGLDTLAYIDRGAPDFAESMRWARKHLSPADGLLLEAPSSSSDFKNPVSVATGHPTLLGWLQHEEIWRGPDPEIYRRYIAAEQFYRRGATPENLGWARFYRIGYVFIGPREESLYGGGVPGSIAQRFEGWSTVFRQGTVRIVAVPR